MNGETFLRKLDKPPATELFVDGIWIDTPGGIKQVEEKNLKEHMCGRRNTYHSENSRVKPVCEPDGRSIALRKQIAEETSSEWKQYAPAEAHPFLEHGRCKLPKEHRKDYNGIFDSPIPFTTFKKYHKSKSKNKALRISEVRRDRVSSANTECRQLICSVLSLVYQTGKIIHTWDHEIMNWIPKEMGNPAVDRHRPIALLEVLRKITLGVKKQQVFDVWIKHNLLDIHIRSTTN